jgi:cell division protein FtsA
VPIHSVYTGISGSHIRGLNSAWRHRHQSKEVTPEDVDRVIEAARVVAIPADQKILHILPQEFIIDGQEGIQDPLGMSGVRLEARVHIVTRRGQRRSEHRQVRPALWAGGG